MKAREIQPLSYEKIINVSWKKVGRGLSPKLISSNVK